jgi:hypothetical protein
MLSRAVRSCYEIVDAVSIRSCGGVRLVRMLRDRTRGIDGMRGRRVAIERLLRSYDAGCGNGKALAAPTR